MLDCHFVGHWVKSEKPLCPSSLSRPINTAPQAQCEPDRMQAVPYVMGEPSGIGARHTILAARRGITIMRRFACRASIPGLARRLCQFWRADGYLSRRPILPHQRVRPPCGDFLKADPFERFDLYFGMGDQRIRRIEAAPATVHCRPNRPGTPPIATISERNREPAAAHPSSDHHPHDRE
jgi:hypothetical protein